MKKTYINPTLKVVKINLQHVMIVTSDTPATNNEVLGRRARFSNWEDEEEEF